ncbi:hypothetical protein AB833_22015 [Chromatiales bacterium (ex Bugula neritina AB1)]|nr:hypothetical protein AB833_22015 [Chromatiales bacterium (ex Bugula neritina AB1)]
MEKLGRTAVVMSRPAVAGILLLLMIFSSIADDVIGTEFYWPDWLAGTCGWLAALLLLLNISVSQRWQTGFIAAAGAVLLMIADSRGSPIDISAAVGNNAALISMIASVGFLRLVAMSADDKSSELPIGPAAYYKTLLGVSVFGSVINISAPILFADRLAAQNKLSRLASQSLTRIFSGCSAWSPFFGGMAAVLINVPGMQLQMVMLLCFPFALVGLLVVGLEAHIRYRHLLDKFHGYPVQFSSMWVPAALALLVLLLSEIFPHWSVLSRISVAALVLTVVVLLMRVGSSKTLANLVRHVTGQLPGMVNELVLFLAAGVLAAGISSVVGAGLISVPLLSFHYLQASGLVIGMVLLSMVGIHPLVSVSGITPLLLTFDPDPNLLAVSYLLAWSLGTCASPLSGTHLVFQGRYGIPSWRGALWNWPYVTVMSGVAVLLLYTVDAIA